MDIQKVSCASCGAPIQIPTDIERLNCSYCGAALIIQRGEGYVALKLAEEISQTIQDSGFQTQSAIRDSAQVTQAEMKRLQLSQELSAAQLLLSTTQAEIRGLERQKRNRKIGRQLKELRVQESNLLSRIRGLQASLSSLAGEPARQQVITTNKPANKSKLKKGCLTGCLVYIIVGMGLGLLATPLDRAIFHVDSEIASGPFFMAAVLIGFFMGVIAFIYVQSSENPIWKSISVQRFFSWWANIFRKQGLVGKIVLGGVSLITLSFLCSVPVAISSLLTSPTDSTKTSTVEAISTSAPVKTEKPTAEVIKQTVAPTNIPEPTSTEVVGLLPGLMPADVKVNLEQRGLTCGSGEQGEIYYVWTCKQETAQYTLVVDIYSRTIFTVDYLDSGAIQYGTPDIEMAKSFLGFMATMPYDGAVPQEARIWVENTIPTLEGKGDVREKVFAGVVYRLFGIPTAYTLEMGDLP